MSMEVCPFTFFEHWICIGPENKHAPTHWGFKSGKSELAPNKQAQVLIFQATQYSLHGSTLVLKLQSKSKRVRKKLRVCKCDFILISPTNTLIFTIFIRAL